MIKPTSWVNGVNEGASRPVPGDNLFQNEGEFWVIKASA